MESIYLQYFLSNITNICNYHFSLTINQQCNPHHHTCIHHHQHPVHHFMILVIHQLVIHHQHQIHFILHHVHIQTIHSICLHKLVRLSLNKIKKQFFLLLVHFRSIILQSNIIFNASIFTTIN